MNGIALSWPLAYVGVFQDWISPNDVLKDISLEELNKLDENSIAELYVAAEESKDSFLNLLKNICGISDELVITGRWVWSIAYLNNIYNSDKVIFEKLRDIESVWVMAGYPENWKHFIYYMPVVDGAATGEKEIYKKFADFLQQENVRIKKMGYLEA